MKKKKVLVIAGGIVCIAIIAVAASFVFKKDRTDNDDKVDKGNFEYVREKIQSDIVELKDGKYDNLIYNDFEISLDNVEGVYNIEIESDNSYLDRSFLENFAIMDEVIDKFFVEDFDKSYIAAHFNVLNDKQEEETVYIYYNDIETECVDEKYNKPETDWLFGNNTSEGGYMVQIMECLSAAWFSRGEMGDIGPFHDEIKKAYRYINCLRQSEDVEINLKDGTVMLSEMEQDVQDYLNNSFPLPVSGDISLGIAEVSILDNGDYQGVCFNVRRIYKGIPFEYGTVAQSSMYIDFTDRDSGMLIYAVSEYPDTMMSFGRLNGTVIETSEITELLSLSDAFDILSESIGDNSVYDVYGTELVYRNCEIPEERVNGLDDILVPKWKIITKNRNDDKYTIFYVDVVTGEITERFEPYYE